MFITNNLNGREGGFQMVFKNGWTVSVEWHEELGGLNDGLGI